MKQIYLDYAAATPIDDSVQKAMKPYYSDNFYNPSATYLKARSVKKDLESARNKVARLLGSRSSEVVFTAGGTEANNLAIHGIMSRWSGSNVIISDIEHASVRQPACKYDYKVVPVDGLGIIDNDKLKKLIDDKTVLLSIMLANNEIGTIQNLATIFKLVKEIRHERILQGNPLPLYLHSDACQAANYLSLKNPIADLMSLNGGKIYGPKQSGVLYVNRAVKLSPIIEGGGQENGWRSGTENVAQVIGFAEALEKAQNMRDVETTRLANIQYQAIDRLIDLIPGAVVNGSAQSLLQKDVLPGLKKKAAIAGNRLANNLHITIPGQDAERLMMQLDEQGFMCAVGSACSASSEEPSHVLSAIGLSEEDARASLRLSFGRGTKSSDVIKCIEALAKIVDDSKSI
jgi:cysteine desulfurase